MYYFNLQYSILHHGTQSVALRHGSEGNQLYNSEYLRRMREEEPPPPQLGVQS